MSELPKHYDPHALEAKWYPHWVERGFFHGDAARGGEPFCVVIPPPNVTGILHMGHALNNTIQDVLVRRARMRGRNTTWVPGTDHAGIATQNVVEKQLRKEGLSRNDLGREAFVERVWAWKKQYGDTIIGQLKKLGASCDWDRERFTLDEGLSDAVAEVFVRLFDKGLIYRGNYIVNWCPRCLTALSDEESEHEDLGGKLFYIRYPIAGGDRKKDFITVATTRPETLLGDVAVAVNPKDERYAALLGKELILPVLHRKIPVIADDFVDPAFGTGAVKVTPAHDPNDYAMGQRHNLPQINVMHDDATMNDAAGPYAGMDRAACREALIEDLKEGGLVEKIEDHRHAVGHCYRCHTMVEPRLSAQWFVRMKPLAEPALAAVRDGRIRFVPDRWNKVYGEWMENIRDWCISRQIWWGHRIPVFYCDACDHVWAAKGRPEACPQCGSGALRQDPDVLDTWFSSWLWPFSVFGWPATNADLALFYPTNTLVTASEIIFFWVARMIMAGLEFMGDIPFREVYIHGTVRDDTGLKMSKSLGNSIDPLDIIRDYSADALRFSLMMLTATGQDVYISSEKFELGRNFGTKIWNAARFMQMAAGDPPPAGAAEPFDPAALAPDDRFLLARLNETIRACDEHIDRFRFNDYAKTLYEFIWHRYCDWYLEYAKPVLNGADPARRAAVTGVMHHVFSRAIRLLHPLMPFLTEELWHGMGYAGTCESVMIAPWPEAESDATLARWGVTPDAVAYVEAKYETITASRNLRADYGIAPGAQVTFHLKPAGATHAANLEADRAALAAWMRAETLAIDPAFEPAQTMPSAMTGLGTLHLSLAGQVDLDAERKKADARIAETDADIERVNRKLANQDFVSRAPPEVVDVQRRRRQELLDLRDKLLKLREGLGH